MSRVSLPTCKHLKLLSRGLKLVSVLYMRGLHCVESLAQCRDSQCHTSISRLNPWSRFQEGERQKERTFQGWGRGKEPPTALSSSGTTGHMLLSSYHVLLMISSNSSLKCQFGVKCFCSLLVLHKTLMLNKLQREVLSVFQGKNTLNVSIPFNKMVPGLISNDAAKPVFKEWQKLK